MSDENLDPFEGLPKHIIEEILLNVPIKSRASTSAVSKRFSNANKTNITMQHLHWMNRLSNLTPTTLKQGKIEILITNGTRKLWITIMQPTTQTFNIRISEKDRVDISINIDNTTKKYSDSLSLEDLNVYQKMVVILIAILVTIKNHFIKDEPLQAAIYGYKPIEYNDTIASITEWGNTILKSIFGEMFEDITRLNPIFYMNVPNHLYNKEQGHISRSSVTIIEPMEGEQVTQRRRKFMIL